VPSSASRVLEQLGEQGSKIAPPVPIFPRLELQEAP
jgi:hypothetical protein